MSYVTKNYTEQGGEVTHIGGKLVFDEGAEGVAANVEMHSQTTGAAIRADLDALVVALKDANLIAGDEWNLAVKDKSSVTWANLPTAETLSNTGHVTAAIDGTKITVTLDCTVADLAVANHGATWGKHKWFAIGVDTGFDTDGVAGVVFNDGTAEVVLTDADDSEAITVGLSKGDFVLYFKAEKVLEKGARFTLSGKGMKKTSYDVKIVETTT